MNDELLGNAHLVVSFGCLVSAMFPKEKFEEWQVPDPQTIEEFGSVKDNLVARINVLIRERNL